MMSVETNNGLRVPAYLRSRKSISVLAVCMMLVLTVYYNHTSIISNEREACQIHGSSQLDGNTAPGTSNLEKACIDIAADRERIENDTAQLDSIRAELDDQQNVLNAEREILQTEREELQAHFETLSGVGSVEIVDNEWYISSERNTTVDALAVNRSAEGWHQLLQQIGVCDFDDLAGLTPEHWDGDMLTFKPPNCKLMVFDNKEVVVGLLKNKHISMVGDSIARQIYFFLVYTVWKALGKQFNPDLGGCRWTDADFYDEEYNIRLTYQNHHWGARACALGHTLWRPSLPDHVWWNSGLHHQAQQTNATTEYTEAVQAIKCVQEATAPSADSPRKPMLWLAETTSTHNGGQKGNLLNTVTDHMNVAMAATLRNSGVHGRMVHLRRLTEGPQLHLKDQVHFMNAPLMALARLFLHHILLNDGLTADAIALRDGETEEAFVERVLLSPPPTDTGTDTGTGEGNVAYGFPAMEKGMDAYVSCDPGPEWRTATSRKQVLEKENSKNGITKNDRRLIHEEGIAAIRAAHNATTKAKYAANDALSSATCCEGAR